MKRIPNPRDLVATLLLAALAVATVAPAAEANQYKGHRYKDDPRGAPVVRPFHRPARVVELRRSSSDFPALAGFFGGLALGTILSGAAERDDHYRARPPEPECYYYDPYCRERFASLESYRSHLGWCHHPGFVRVIDSGTGDCIHAYEYRHGGWQDADDEGEYGYDD